MSIGIDFGTTNSVVARFASGATDVLTVDQPPMDWAGLGFDKVLPTVFGRGDGDAPIFGWDAKRRPGSLAAVKRLLRAEERADVDGVDYSIEEIATLIFGQLKREAANQGAPFDRAVVTIPANSRGLARYRTKVCAGMAGIQVMALINEPTAAAMAYGMRSAHEETLMVVDWGGGTLDVTVLRNVEGVFIEQASKGIQALGGLDFDAALSRMVVETVADASSWSPDDKAAFRLDIERAKIQLSNSEQVSVPVPGGGYRQVTRSMFEKAVRSQVERVREPIEQCLRDLRATPANVDALVLVGGTCKMPAVRGVVSDVLGKAPASGIDAMTAVAEGASIAAAILSRELDSHDFFVSTEHALGTITLSKQRELMFSELIPRNHKLPARATHSYQPVVDFQESLDIEVIEGDPARPLDHEDNVVMKTWNVKLPVPRPMDEVSIELTYSYDVDGILHVNAKDDLGTTILDDDVSFGVNLSKRDLVDIAGRTNRTLDAGRIEAPTSAGSALDPATRQLVVNVRTKIIPFIDDSDARRLAEIAARVESGDRSAISELETAARSYSYLL